MRLSKILGCLLLSAIVPACMAGDAGENAEATDPALAAGRGGAEEDADPVTQAEIAQAPSADDDADDLTPLADYRETLAVPPPQADDIEPAAIVDSAPSRIDRPAGCDAA